MRTPQMPAPELHAEDPVAFARSSSGRRSAAKTTLVRRKLLRETYNPV
jgi:hypothetical protein